MEEQANTDDGAKRLELITEALKIEAEDVPRLTCSIWFPILPITKI